MSDGLTAFERRRAENARANNEILNSISKTSAKVFAAPKAAPAPKPKRSASRRIKSEPVKREAPVPTRRSARVAGIDSGAVAAAAAGADDDLKYGLGESAALEHKAKKQRVHGDLSLSDMQVDGRWAASSLSGLGLGALRGPAQPGVRTFDFDAAEDKKTDKTDKTMQALRAELGALQLYDGFPVKDLKLTKERIYAMAFHPTEDKPLVFAGDKEGRLGIFDASQKVEDDDDEDEPEIIGFKPHARTISGIAVLDADPASVYTASYDTTIRRLDIHAQKSVEVYAPADADEDAAISCMDWDWAGARAVFFSTLGGALGRHDTRTRPGDAVVWRALHDGHKIGGFSLCPEAAHLVATASLDRTMKIWDLRKMEAAEGDDDGVKVERPFLAGSDAARLSVSHAAWGPGGHIATTSYDDYVRVYRVGTDVGVGAALAADALAPVKIAHNNQTGRWVTILKPQWRRSLGDEEVPLFVVGNMNRFVDVFAADGTQVAQLDGEGITAVPAVAQMHGTRRWVAGGNASGKLTLWM